MGSCIGRTLEMEDQQQQQQITQDEVDQAEIKEEVKKCSNFDKLRKRFSRQSCNRSEPPQLPKGLFSRLKQKYLANSTKPVEATRNPVENGIVDQIPPKSEDDIKSKEESLGDVQQQEQQDEQEKEEDKKEEEKEEEVDDENYEEQQTTCLP